MGARGTDPRPPIIPALGPQQPKRIKTQMFEYLKLAYPHLQLFQEATDNINPLVPFLSGESPPLVFRVLFLFQ